MREELSEGWVDFIRYHCLTGTIDKWIGDSINNPNNGTKHSMCLNSNITYYRCNGSDWISDRELGYNIIAKYLPFYKDFDAIDIWNKTKLNITRYKNKEYISNNH